MANKKNSKLTQAIAVVKNPITFASTTGQAAAVMAVTNAANIQLLIDAVSYEETDPTFHRLFLDEMTPQCRISLVRMLTDMKANSIV